MRPSLSFRTLVPASIAVAALLLSGCGSDSDSTSTTGDSTTASSTTTEAANTSESGSDEGSSSSTTAPASSSTTEAETDTTAAPTPSPGDPCSLSAGIADCIDPDEDGQGVYLIGGAECAANAPHISVCEDLDGDGNAGYPDEHDDLPACGEDVPPPCNNPKEPVDGATPADGSADPEGADAPQN